MFKETKEGQTHSENDNCGEPEHNNCVCKEPQPDDSVDSLNFGGRFNRCKVCKGRVWH